MKIPTSEDAVKNSLQFKEVFYNRDLPERLCLKDIYSKTVVKRDDSSHHAKKTAEMCEKGEAFCWMNCLPLPDPFCTSSHNLTCTNNQDQQCFDDSMDGTCEWKCNGTAPQPKSEFCTRLIWVTTHLIGRLGIRFRVSREVVNQGLPGTNCFGLPSLQRKLHPIALPVAVPESTV